MHMYNLYKIKVKTDHLDQLQSWLASETESLRQMHTYRRQISY